MPCPRRFFPPSMVFVLLWLTLSAAGRPAAAQGRLSLGLAAGPSPYDLDGTGTGTAGAAFLTWRPVRGLVVEPTVAGLTYRSQFERRTSILLPELSVQGELTLGAFHPFLGGGAGAIMGLSGSPPSGATLHAVGGSRYDLGNSWGLRGEMRVRAMHPWTGNSVDFLFGVSRSLQGIRADGAARPVESPRVPSTGQPGRFELAMHLGVHVDRNGESDRVVTDNGAEMYATSGEAGALDGRLGYWVKPSVGLQLDLSRSSNSSWEGSTPVYQSGPPSFANRTTYVSARGVLRTSPLRRFNLFAAAGPAIMLYGGPGTNLRTRDYDVGGVVETGARLRVNALLGVELAVSNYLYHSNYRDGDSVFRHDLLILSGLVFTWP